MKSMKAIVNTIHWVNIGGIAVQIAGVLPPKPWVLALQAVLAALMPSLHGIGHRVAFDQPQVKG